MHRIVKIASLFFAIVICFVQLAIILYPIYSNEKALEQGQKIILKAIPLDPYDFLRGRYISLNYEIERIDWGTDKEKLFADSEYEECYLVLEKQDNGVYTAIDVVIEKPKDGSYLSCQFSYGSRKILNSSLKKYYMNEKLAPKAEEILRNSRGDNNEYEVHVVIYKHNNVELIHDILVDGKNISDFLLGSD